MSEIRGLEANPKKMKAVLKIQSVAIKAIHDYFEEAKFIQLLPVILSPSTDPIASGYESNLVPGTIEYNGQELKLTQSMMLHKQVAIGNGIDKLYVFSPNVRLENPQLFYTGSHLIEFSQVDFEVVNATMSDIFKLVEGLMRRVRIDVESKARDELELLNRKLPPWEENFVIYSKHDLESQYGDEWAYKASKDHTVPFFVLCHDRYFYDRFEREGDRMNFKNYNLVFPEGFGISLSGGEREYDFEKLIARMKTLGLSRFDYHEYLLRSQSGLLKPSAGAGFGVERLVRYLTGLEHIGDVQLFRRVPGENIVL